VGFETTISAAERPLIDTLDHAATVFTKRKLSRSNNKNFSTSVGFTEVTETRN